MKLHILLNKISTWAQGDGPEAEIVISSRVRLARNIEGVPFPSMGSAAADAKSQHYVEETVKTIEGLSSSLFVHMEHIDPIDREFLVERHIISKEFGTQPAHRAVVIDNHETSSIMVNEEDHLRLQVFTSGLNLQEAMEVALNLDEQFEKHISFALSPTLGYLTACPTNVGTGMRASVMLHLPALVMTKQINQVLQAVLKLGLTVRGLYGEGSEAAGNFFQISNQVSLGVPENDIISNLHKIVRQIIGHEQNARSYLLKKERVMVEDKVGRSYGILQGARLITSRESIEHLSVLRMGADMGSIQGVTRKTINELFIITQPAHLQKIAEREMEPIQRDILRAELIRTRLHTETP